MEDKPDLEAIKFTTHHRKWVNPSEGSSKVIKTQLSAKRF